MDLQDRYLGCLLGPIRLEQKLGEPHVGMEGLRALFDRITEKSLGFKMRPRARHRLTGAKQYAWVLGIMLDERCRPIPRPSC